MDESNGKGKLYTYMDQLTGKTMERYVSNFTGKMYIKPFGADATQWKEIGLVEPGSVKLNFKEAYKVGEDIEGAVILDPNDPFEKALLEIVNTNRRKRRDYADSDATPFSNFEQTSGMLGITDFTRLESALFNVAQKFARIRSLRIRGTSSNPSNEAVLDSYLDMAVYATIAYAMAREDMSSLQAGERKD